MPAHPIGTCGRDGPSKLFSGSAFNRFQRWRVALAKRLIDAPSRIGQPRILGGRRLPEPDAVKLITEFDGQNDAQSAAKRKQ
jgi:hypothetical protein